MPIRVVCLGCKKSFNVSEKYAGKKGNCPNCKAIIEIPKQEEQVVIHAPEDFGPKGAGGKPVLKPVAVSYAKWNPQQAALIGGGVFFVLLMAVLMRLGLKGEVPLLFLAVGAIALAPPLALAGYSLFRDEELEAFRGQALWLRIGICSLAIALIWLAPWYINYMVFANDGGAPIEIWQMMALAAGMVALGGLAALATLDLTYTSGCILYATYLGATVLLRTILMLHPFVGGPTAPPKPKPSAGQVAPAVPGAPASAAPGATQPSS